MSAGCSRSSSSLQRRLALLVDGALGELGVRFAARVPDLLAHQPFDEPVLAQQRRHLGERVLHACARLGPYGVGVSSVSGMAGSIGDEHCAANGAAAAF